MDRASSRKPVKRGLQMALGHSLPKEWQCVLVVWGDRYPVAEINLLIETIRRQAASLLRVVVITDRDRPGLDEAVVCRPFPEFFLKPEFRGGGCQAKLAMFEAGVVPDDVPAVFVDLDTLVLGDLGQMTTLLDRPDRVAILHSAVLPFGAVARVIFRLTKGKRYARGNSSVVVWHPAHGTEIAARFRALYAQHGGLGFRPMIADERFVSWAAQLRIRSVPNWLAVKLPTEYMQPYPWLVLLRAGLPWIRRRRARLVAVTLPGSEVKGLALLDLPNGAVITDTKGRKLIWTDRALGPMKQQLIAYYQRLKLVSGA